MDKEVQQLVDMGARPAQARAALKRYKDVMQAAERIFDGQFDDVQDDADDVVMASSSTSRAPERIPHRLPSPEDQDADDDDDDDDDEEMADEDDEDDAFVDYDSDVEAPGAAAVTDIDPYAGIFFSKDRKEEVIEVEEEPETFVDQDTGEQVNLMTQGEWMKGCPEGSEQSFLFSLYSELSEGRCKCSHCGELSVARKKSDFFALYNEFSAYTEHVKGLVERVCRNCTRTFCLACGDLVSEERRTNSDPLYHCANLQGVILGVGLAMVERNLTEQSHDAPREIKDDSRNSKRRRTAVITSVPNDSDENLDYYSSGKGKKSKGGIGYAGDVKEDNAGQIEAQNVQRNKDTKTGKLLAAVREFLPNLQRDGGGHSSDYLVHPTTLAHLRRRFNHVCSLFLRNDSLADMSERSVLYFELFEWLETVSNHEALASLMAQPIMVVSSVKSMTTKKSNSRHRIRERQIVYEGSAGPRELLESIVIQATAAIKSLDGLKPYEVTEEMTEMQKRVTNDLKGKAKEDEETSFTEENAKLLDFSRRILATANSIDRFLRETKGDAFVDRLHASLPTISSSSANQPHVEEGDSEEKTQEAYVAWASRARFEYCDLTVPAAENVADADIQDPHYKFFFDNEARMLASSDIPKRSLAIAKELAVLTTNLPVAWNSSIFLRVDETRVDVIKALITGPEGTPYYNGCYLFDIFLGASYNQSALQRQTNGGKYRFNPNLYADGKVCLSLLGTWQGPGWVAGKSTLLQVLISIQSMILCEEPYLNEPGWANEGGTPQSRAYSANVRRMAVKTAMLGNLKSPPEPFEDVIRTHYRLKARSVTAQLDQWLSQDDGKPTLTDGGAVRARGSEGGGGSSNGFQRDVDEFKRLLEVLRLGGM